MAKIAVSIEYCTTCKFGGRASWLAQELLAAHEAEIASMTLVPSGGGVFAVRFDGEEVFSNKETGRFPEPREIKEALRERSGLPPKPRHD